jgi:hypothetical protein
MDRSGRSWGRHRASSKTRIVDWSVQVLLQAQGDGESSMVVLNVKHMGDRGP